MARARPTSAARIQRLLAMLQWAAGHAKGVPVAELCQRFRLRPDELARELDLASMVGADSPHYDDMPFEVFVEDGRVYVRLFSFRRPLRLTPSEGLALVAAADVLVDRDRDGDDGPLARALAKLAGLLGIEPGQQVDVDLDPEGGPSGRLIRQALEERRRVGVTYWTYGRDEVAHREVDPWQLFSHAGSWYLAGLAHDVGAERRFRLDRMESVVILDTPAAEPTRRAGAEIGVTDGAPQVVLDLAPSARWVAEAHPVVKVEALADGFSRVTLAVAGPSWLERLLLQLGADATVVDIDEELGDRSITAVAARRVLARYRVSPQEAPH